MPEQSRSHFLDGHWLAAAWPLPHWLMLRETIDPATSPRSCLMATFVRDANLAGLFVGLQPAQGAFDLLVTLEADWPTCG
ncbi:MAG: hypothetical protein NTW19_02565 [Planctomycetota bacterium]|nr:hypothetical protein [Planctomycetota bacterium]